MGLIGSLRDTLGIYNQDVMAALMKPSKIKSSAKRGLKHALGYFIASLMIFGGIAWSIDSAKLIYDISGSQITKEMSEEIPDFTIDNGRFKLNNGQQEPYYVAPNFVIDTTGEVTEPPVDENGEGILITGTQIIRKRFFKTETIEFKDIEGYVKNRDDFVSGINKILMMMLPILIIFMLAFKLSWYAIYCLGAAATFSVSAVVYRSIKNIKGDLPELIIPALYAQTPILAMTILAALAPSYMSIPIAIMGFIWAAATYAIAIKNQ